MSENNNEKKLYDVLLTKISMNTLMKFFKRNKAENFLALTLEDNGNKYSVSIENCNRKISVAEKLCEQKQEIENLKEKLRSEKFVDNNIYYLLEQQNNKIQELRELVHMEDIPHPTIPEYRELHDKMQRILKFIDENLLDKENYR